MIEFRTLGTLELRAGDGRRVSSDAAQPKPIAVLAVLAADRSFTCHRRDTLLGLLWPDLPEARARHALSQTLYVLRRGLGTGIVVTRGQNEVGLDLDEIWCDAAAFDRLLAQGCRQEAMDLYRGNFLEGFHVPRSREFEDWMESRRRTLRQQATATARQLAAEHKDAGDLGGAIGWVRHALDLAPLDELAFRDLVALLDRTGNRSGAMDAYAEFADRFRRTFEVDPAPETIALARAVQWRAELVEVVGDPARGAAVGGATAPASSLSFTPAHHGRWSSR